MRHSFFLLLITVLALGCPATRADILVLQTFGFAGGQVVRLDELTGDQLPGWSFNPQSVNPSIGQLSGLTVHNGIGYVSSLDTGQVFHFNLATGAAIGDGVFANLPLEPDDPRLLDDPNAVASPSAIEVGSDGLLYVGDNGGTSVLRFNVNTGAFVDRVVDGLVGAGSVGFTNDGTLLTTDGLLGAPASIYSGVGDPPAVLYDSSISGLTSANGLLVQGDGNFLIADLFSNTVFKYAADGTSIAPFPQTFLVPQPDDVDLENPPNGAIDLLQGEGEFYSTFPSDVDFDAGGNILVTTLGISSIVQAAPENYGSILRYSPEGALLERVADDLFAPSAIVLTPGLVDVAGDYDRDGFVDAADYALWRETYGSQVTSFSNADGNGDGVIDAADYTIWRDNLGAGNEPGLRGAPAPEPTACLLLTGLAWLGLAQRRR